MITFDEPTAVADAIDSLERPLLLVFDCDGVLSPITDHADDSVLIDGMRSVLSELSTVEHVQVAVLSGRSLAGLEQFDFPDAIAIAGSYGGERQGQALEDLSGTEAELLSQATQLVERSAALAGAGAWVEHKPTSVVLHVREAATESGDEALAFIAEESTRLDLAAAHEGSRAFELMARSADKGTGLNALRHEFEPASVVYLGDDVPDEDAFAQLRSGDLGVKVGAAPTLAALRLEDPTAVLMALRALSRRLLTDRRPD